MSASPIDLRWCVTVASSDRSARLALANFAQVANRSQAEHGREFHSMLASGLRRGYPRLAIVHAKIAECFDARVLDLCRETFGF